MQYGLLALVGSTVLCGAASAQTLPDVVMLRDGGMLRGTILESTPGEAVTIQLPNGDPRTVEWSEVQYAGPESDRPRTNASTRARRASPAPPSSREVDLRVRSEQSRLTLYRTDDGLDYERLCSVPCELSLEPGRQHFAIARDGGAAIPAPRVELRGESTLTATYLDRSGARVAGTILSISSIVAFTAVFIPLLIEDQVLEGLGGGFGALAGLLIIGMPLSFLEDGADVRLE